MTDIDAKALALPDRLRIIPDANGMMYDEYDDVMEAADLIEQHEATTKEIERLKGVIIATADHWLALQTEHPIAWEGAIDEAMAAACAKIRELTEQHEAFKQEVSDALVDYFGEHLVAEDGGDTLASFIIPKPKPDPLVEVLEVTFAATGIGSANMPKGYPDILRAALDALGFEIREKSNADPKV
jgi:hypothetical protein